MRDASDAPNRSRQEMQRVGNGSQRPPLQRDDESWLSKQIGIVTRSAAELPAHGGRVCRNPPSGTFGHPRNDIQSPLMQTNSVTEPHVPPGGPQFATTQWSLVVAASEADAAVSQQALAELCQAYWLPVYVYVRRRTPDVHTAQDLTQAFFERLLEQRLVEAADPARGSGDEAGGIHRR